MLTANLFQTEHQTMFAECLVPAESLEDFLSRYYRHDRYKGRGEEYAHCVLNSHREDLQRFGIDWISGKDSCTGSCVAWMPGGSL